MTTLTSDSSVSLSAVVNRSFQASLALATIRNPDRNRVLKTIAQRLKEEQDGILEANTLDLEASRDMAVPELLLDWLKLTPERLQTTYRILLSLGSSPEPLQFAMGTAHPFFQGQLTTQRTPLGPVALVYESLPELGAIAAGLCLKTGNSLILKGGSEASHTNQAIADVMRGALEHGGLPSSCVELLPTTQETSVRELLVQNQILRLVIPYGRPSFVQQVLRQAAVPTLRTAMGNCYLYWAPSGSLELVRCMVLDSHIGVPDPVNAIEKVLVPTGYNSTALVTLFNALQDKGFTPRLDPGLQVAYPDFPQASASEWNQAYLNRSVAFKVVEDLDGAIAWINTHSSGHADCLATASDFESQQFAARIRSAAVYINTSPRFSRDPDLVGTVALGMANGPGRTWGPITLETLTTLKRIIRGRTQEE